MTDFPVYDPQTKSEQRRMLKHSPPRWYIWLAAYHMQGNRYGRQEPLAVPLLWPCAPYLPYVAASRRGLREPVLLLLLEEARAHYPDLVYAPFLLPQSELDYLAGRFEVYAWPDLVFDKVRWRCGGVWSARYDEEVVCC